MATYTVTTLDDVVDALDGLTSLREAIALANADIFIDIITFATAGTITLSSKLDVTQIVTINGDIGDDHTADITIDGGGTVQIINATADIALQGLVLTHGHSDLEGGAITTTGALIIVDSSLIDNTAAGDGGGAYAGGDATITNSTLSGNTADGSGGGIVASGTLAVTGSLITINSATGDGGGAYAGGAVTITDSTVSGNAGNHGGGINTVGTLTAIGSTFNGNTSTGIGGAVAAAQDVTLTNTTVTDNTALIGGGVSTLEDFAATNATFSGNAADISAGAVNAFGGITASNSIFLGDTVASVEDELSGGSITYQGLNIVGIGSDVDASNHVINAAALDAVLAVDGSGKAFLADNGGPVATIALVDAASNPALDASDASGTAADARGAAAFDRTDVANTQGSARDLGAYEYTDPPATYTVTNLNDSGAGSLRDTIALANAHFGADTITFAAGLTGGTITLASKLQVTDAVTINGDIDGNHTADVTISGNGAVQILHATADLAVQGLVLTRGLAVGVTGGAVSVTGIGYDLTILDSALTLNRAENGGGAYTSGNLTV
jgi:predicted outer membrane repeat protein